MRRMMFTGALVALSLSLSPVRIDAQQAVAQDLAAAITALDTEIRGAQTFAATVTDGALKEAALARVVLLQVTRDMLQQRALASRYNIALTYTIAGRAAQPREPSKAALAELDSHQARATALLAEAATDPLKQIELAAVYATIAGLRQKVLFERFGIPLLSAIQAPTAAAAAPVYLPERPPPRVDPAPAAPPDLAPTEVLDLMSIEARVTEQNRVFARFAWKMRVKNLAPRRLAFDATIEFQDKDGFVLHTARAYDLGLAAYDDHEFTGEALISIAPAGRVAKYVAKMRPKP